MTPVRHRRLINKEQIGFVLRLNSDSWKLKTRVGGDSLLRGIHDGGFEFFLR